MAAEDDMLTNPDLTELVGRSETRMRVREDLQRLEEWRRAMALPEVARVVVNSQLKLVGEDELGVNDAERAVDQVVSVLEAKTIVNVCALAFNGALGIQLTIEQKDKIGKFFTPTDVSDDKLSRIANAFWGKTDKSP